MKTLSILSFKSKKGKSIISVFIIGFVIVMLFVSISVFAQSNETASNETEAESSDENPPEQEGKNVNDVDSYIKRFAKNSGIKEDEINEIKEVDLNNLPEEVVIKNVKETNIGVYEVNYTKENQEKKIFVVTYASPSFDAKENPIVACKSVQPFNFGLSETMMQSTFLKTATGVMSSKEQGYVMTKDGSITGLSTNINVLVVDGEARIKIKVLRNGEDTGLENIFETSSAGIFIDYDVQSEYINKFSAGDVISVYLELSGNAEFTDVINIVEITA